MTAFRIGMDVHGRYKEPYPECGAPVQCIRYASNETNYCANCQTGGKLLADRSMSRLLKSDSPKTLTELEETAMRDTETRRNTDTLSEAPKDIRSTERFSEIVMDFHNG